MQVDIYRPAKRTDLFFFVRSGTDPRIYLEQILAQFGALEFIKTRDLGAGQKLIGATTDQIIHNISQSGFHIQGINVTSQVSEGGAALGGGILGASVGGPIGALIGALLGYALGEHAKKVPDEL